MWTIVKAVIFFAIIAFAALAGPGWTEPKSLREKVDVGTNAVPACVSTTSYNDAVQTCVTTSAALSGVEAACTPCYAQPNSNSRLVDTQGSDDCGGDRLSKESAMSTAEQVSTFVLRLLPGAAALWCNIYRCLD